MNDNDKECWLAFKAWYMLRHGQEPNRGRGIANAVYEAFRAGWTKALLAQVETHG